jgi:hypothetical protein
MSTGVLGCDDPPLFARVQEQNLLRQYDRIRSVSRVKRLATAHVFRNALFATTRHGSNIYDASSTCLSVVSHVNPSRCVRAFS